MNIIWGFKESININDDGARKKFKYNIPTCLVICLVKVVQWENEPLQIGESYIEFGLLSMQRANDLFLGNKRALHKA